MSRNPAGRPTKFTPKTIEKFLNELRAGNYQETACRVAGITTTTLANWKNKALEDDAPKKYVAFLEAIKDAEAESESINLKKLLNAGEKQWQAIAWWLERKDPDRWGRRERRDIKIEGQLKTEVNGGNNEELIAILRRLEPGTESDESVDGESNDTSADDTR